MSLRAPCHTTRHADPHRAVRGLRSTWRVVEVRAGRSSGVGSRDRGCPGSGRVATSAYVRCTPGQRRRPSLATSRGRSSTSFPVLELQRPQPVADPLVEIGSPEAPRDAGSRPSIPSEYSVRSLHDAGDARPRLRFVISRTRSSARKGAWCHAAPRCLRPPRTEAQELAGSTGATALLASLTAVGVGSSSAASPSPVRLRRAHVDVESSA